MKPSGLTLLIVDRNTLLAEGIAAAVTSAGYDEARAVASLDRTYRVLDAGWLPSVALVELDLVAPNDFEALERLQSYPSGFPIVVTVNESALDDQQLIVRAFIRGALGLVSKDQGIGSLLRVLEVVRKGEAAIPRSLALAVVEALRAGPPAPKSELSLSPRQRQVLALVARGMTDREIAGELDISLPTVRSHLDAIFEKTGTSNRTAAAHWASFYAIVGGVPE